MESRVLQSMHSLPLEESKWIDALVVTAQQGYERENTTHIINAAGFSIKESVKTLEKLYRGELK